MDNVGLYDLKRNETLQKKIETEILKSAQYIVANTGAYTANNIAFAYQALAHPENYVSGYLGYAIMDGAVQAAAGAVADAVIASIVAAHINDVWK